MGGGSRMLLDVMTLANHVRDMIKPVIERFGYVYRVAGKIEGVIV
jgi:hypothetical protein